MSKSKENSKSSIAGAIGGIIGVVVLHVVFHKMELSWSAEIGLAYGLAYAVGYALGSGITILYYLAMIAHYEAASQKVQQNRPHSHTAGMKPSENALDTQDSNGRQEDTKYAPKGYFD